MAEPPRMTRRPAVALATIALVAIAAASGCGDTPSGDSGAGLLFPKIGMTVVEPAWIVWDPDVAEEPDTLVVHIDGDEVTRDIAWYGTGYVEFDDRPSGEYTLAVELLDEAGDRLWSAEVDVRFERFEPGRGGGILWQRYEDGELTIDELIMAGIVLMHEPDPDADYDDEGGGSATGSMLMLMSYLSEATADTRAAFDLLSGAYLVDSDRYDAWEARQPESGANG